MTSRLSTRAMEEKWRCVDITPEYERTVNERVCGGLRADCETFRADAQFFRSEYAKLRLQYAELEGAVKHTDGINKMLTTENEKILSECHERGKKIVRLESLMRTLSDPYHQQVRVRGVGEGYKAKVGDTIKVMDKSMTGQKGTVETIREKTALIKTESGQMRSVRLGYLSPTMKSIPPVKEGWTDSEEGLKWSAIMINQEYHIRKADENEAYSKSLEREIKRLNKLIEKKDLEYQAHCYICKLEFNYGLH